MLSLIWSQLVPVFALTVFGGFGLGLGFFSAAWLTRHGHYRG